MPLVSEFGCLFHSQVVIGDYDGNIASQTLDQFSQLKLMSRIAGGSALSFEFISISCRRLMSTENYCFSILRLHWFCKLTNWATSCMKC